MDIILSEESGHSKEICKLINLAYCQSKNLLSSIVFTLANRDSAKLCNGFDPELYLLEGVYRDMVIEHWCSDIATDSELYGILAILGYVNISFKV